MGSGYIYFAFLRQAGKSSACVMDIVWEELERNKIDIDNDMLSFHLDA